MKSLAQAIADNRFRHARYHKYEKILRQIRLRVFDYEDAGVDPEKVQRIIHKCKAILKPKWDAQARALEHARGQRMLYTWA